MFILLCVICLVVIVIDLYRDITDGVIAVLFSLIFICCFIGLIWNGVKVIDGRVIDEKIAMYQEENEKIENDIDRLVTQYMSYESETLGELKGDSSITLVSLYPDLKSDELVKAQIETYQANNETIKKLKSDKLKVSVAKWWLYFGK